MNPLERLISVLAPHRCINCGLEGGLLCDDCLHDAPIPKVPSCYRCNAQSDDFLTCKTCRRVTPLKHVWIVSRYEKTIKNLIWQMKFERATQAALPLARVLDTALPYFPPDTLIVPIPTATSRVRQRGYDQSKLIARELAHLRKRLYCPLLQRLGQDQQLGKSRTERLRNLQSMFRVARPRLVRGAHVVLIDDVTTTGATIEAAARILRVAGAKTIDAAVVAKNRL